MSPDEDFSPTGASSGIKYSESFQKYKEMLSATPDSPVFKRTFSEFNSSLFGAVSTLGDSDLIAEDGDYDSKLEQFKFDLLQDPPVEDVPEDVPSSPLPPEFLDDSDVPEPLTQSEHQVSISVTSRVSTHAVAASSQVSNVVSSNITVSSTELEEAPPPLKAVRPAPKKVTKASKKGTKSSKKAAAISEATSADDATGADAVDDATIADDTTPPPLKKAAKAKATPININPPTRTLTRRR